MARPKVVHIKSNTLNKKPTTDQIDYGEIAVNYNSGNTFLAVKDSKNDIKVFTDKTTNDASYAPKSDFNELKQGVINNEQTTSAALNDLNTRVNQLSSVDMGNYATTATTEAIKSDISGLKTSVGANETKISALEANLSSYVPTSRTINGTALTSDITITKVESATTSTNVNGHTVAKSVPSNAVFTDTTYDDVTTSTHGLMTAADKTKLDGIASGATKYSHPKFTAKKSGFYKIAVNNEGHVTGTTNVAESDITGLIGGTPSLVGHTHDDRYYTETEVNTKLATKSNTGHTHTKSEITDLATWARADTKPSYNFSEIGGSVDVTRQLSGKIPEANLPSYVDDVLEYNSKSNFPTSGETGKIYVDISTNLTYRWGGSAYVEISPSLALGETSGTAYRGDYGAIAYAHSQKRSGNPHGVTKSDVGLGNVENKSSAEIRNDITQDNVTTALGYIPANKSEIPTKYAGSKSAGGPANSAEGVIDYNSEGDTITIGYTGPSLNASDITHIAAYHNQSIKNAEASAVISFLSAVTQTELEGKRYVTSSKLNSKGYVTSTELNNKGYVTSTELNNKGYATQSDLNRLSSEIPTTYAGSSSAGGPANSALAVRDYGKSGFTINIGYQGDALNADEIKSIAAYAARKGGETLIKDAPASAVIRFLSAVTQTELNNKGYATQSDLSSSLTGYVPTGRTVNGKRLSQNITIDSVASATTSKSATTSVSATSIAWTGITGKPSEFEPSSHTHSEYVKKTGDTMSGTLRINSTSTALTCTGETEIRGTMNIWISDSDVGNVIFSVNGLARVYGLGIKEGGLHVTGATSLSGNTSIEGDVTVTGRVSASSGFFETSDRRLKNFQGDIEVDFDKLKSIPKKYFYWNMDSKKSKLEIGTSAQEVMEVYPELVSINEAGMLSVAYDKLSVIALKAVDELHEENVALKEKNDELERRLKAIEEKLGF